MLGHLSTWPGLLCCPVLVQGEEGQEVPASQGWCLGLATWGARVYV